MRTSKKIFSIIGIVVVFIIWMQSCAVGLDNALSETYGSTETSGSAGFLVGFMLLVGGICGLSTLDSKIGNIITSLIYLIGGITGLGADAGIFEDLYVWGWFSILCALIFFAGSFSVTPKTNNSQSSNKDNSIDNMEQLKKLNDLKNEGIITQEDFEKKKKELLK